MKYIIILIIVAASVVTQAADATIAGMATNNKLSAKGTTKSAQSIEPLWTTLTKLVEGVLDGDKFVFDLLRLPPQFRLTTEQRMELKGLWSHLNKIRKRLLWTNKEIFVVDTSKNRSRKLNKIQENARTLCFFQINYTLLSIIKSFGT